jgi:hypothetical protein
MELSWCILNQLRPIALIVMPYSALSRYVIRVDVIVRSITTLGNISIEPRPIGSLFRVAPMAFLSTSCPAPLPLYHSAQQHSVNRPNQSAGQQCDTNSTPVCFHRPSLSINNENRDANYANRRKTRPGEENSPLT